MENVPFAHEKNMILLLLGGTFYKHLLGQIG